MSQNTRLPLSNKLFAATLRFQIYWLFLAALKVLHALRKPKPRGRKDSKGRSDERGSLQDRRQSKDAVLCHKTCT